MAFGGNEYFDATMPKITPSLNPYKLVAQQRPAKAKLEEPRVPPFEIKQTLKCNYKPLRFDILDPCQVLEVAYEPKRCASKWLVTVMTSVGPRELDSWHFDLKDQPR